MRSTLRPKMLPDEEWITCRARTVRVMRAKWKEMGLASLADLCAEKIWKSMSWVGYEGTVPVVKALRTVIEWRTTAWWRTRSAKGMSEDPANATCWKHKWGFHNKGVNVGYTSDKMGWAERRLDTTMEEWALPRRRTWFPFY